MSLFLIKRFITLIATLVGASIVVFGVLEILPGNAAQMLMGPDAAPEAVAGAGHQAGPDQPALERYWHWISGLLVGDLGQSYAYSTPVLDLILERLRSPCRWRCWRWRSPPCWRCWSACTPRRATTSWATSA